MEMFLHLTKELTTFQETFQTDHTETKFFFTQICMAPPCPALFSVKLLMPTNTVESPFNDTSHHNSALCFYMMCQSRKGSGSVVHKQRQYVHK